MAGYMFKIETPARQGAPPAIHIVMAIGRSETGATAALRQVFHLGGDETVAAFPIGDDLVEFMGLNDGDVHFWKP